MGGADPTPARAESETSLKQYEIRWANLPLAIGRRPVLLVTRTSAYAYLAKNGLRRPALRICRLLALKSVTRRLYVCHRDPLRARDVVIVHAHE